MTTDLSPKRLKAMGVIVAGLFLTALSLQAFSSGYSPSVGMSVIKGDRITAKVLGYETPELEDLFAGIALTSRAAFVFDVTAGKALFALNAYEKLPLASITKVMTAMIAREHASKEAVITLTDDNLAIEGDSGLLAGERWRLGDLSGVMFAVSSNDAAHAISGFVGSDGQNAYGIPGHAHFIQMMNEKARELGLTSMEFFNESGLDVDETRNGGYGSARDVAFLAIELYKKFPEVFAPTTRSATRFVSQDGVSHIFPNTNEAIGHFPGLLASKTGYTTLAGGNLVIIFDAGIGRPIAAVVLGSTYKGRFDDMQALVLAARAALQQEI